MLELEHGFWIVDVHARLNVQENTVTQSRESPPERLEREMHQAGVVRAVVHPPTQEGSYLAANNAVARMSVERPFVAVARINGTRDPGTDPGARLRNLAARRSEEHTSPEDVEQYAYDDRFHGFRLHPPRDGLPDRRVLAVLDDVELPVFVHGGVDFPPAAIERTLLGHDFPLVVAHFGGHPLDRRLMERSIELLERHGRLYLDTSFVRYRDLIERAVREHPDRVLFGSGTPAVHPNVAVMEVLTLDVPEDAMRRVFTKNPARVIESLDASGYD